MSAELEKKVIAKANIWLEGNYDAETKQRVKQLIDSDKEELIESFYRDLEFGTGGLRGIMGVGSNRMNAYTVGMATQGLANYLKMNFPSEKISVAIGHDCRNNSRYFAEHVADIFASNGFRVYLFDKLRPTPELSFAIRELKCQSGVMITASHNPKEYNGYKAYWNDGAQVTAPHDVNIIAEVQKITSPDQVLLGKNRENIKILDSTFDEIYLNKVKTLSLSPDAVAANHDMKIVYSPIHGTGVELVPASLRKFGFTNVTVVPEQAVIDGNFPTVESPNPEERTTMKMAIELGKKIGAEIVLATDPDADRIGIALPDKDGDFVLLNGNQTLCLLIYYMMRRWSENGKLNGNQYVIKTIVSTNLVNKIAEKFGVKCFDCLTGFKYIAEIIRDFEGSEMEYIGGGEESFGFMAGDFVRDKDGVSACSLAAEAAAWAKSQGRSLYDVLKELYVEYGFYKEGLVSVVRKGKDGAEEIRQMMKDFRANTPAMFDDSEVVTVKDYQTSTETDLRTGETTPIEIDQSNVLQYITASGSMVSIRPSGTEPKIKYYFGVKAELKNVADFDKVDAELNSRIEAMKNAME